MARFNKIYAGPVDKVLPQVREALVATGVSLTPGMLAVLSSGKFTLAGATTVGDVYVVQDNYLAGGDVEDTYAAGERALGLIPEPGKFYNVIIPTGTNITEIGTPLAPAANGKVGIATDGDYVIFTAEEVYNNNTGKDQLVRVRAAVGYVLPATP